jgi:uncharacterized protein YaaN involved in tellurite resistance
MSDEFDWLSSNEVVVTTKDKLSLPANNAANNLTKVTTASDHTPLIQSELITEQDIESLGADANARVSATTEKIISAVSMQKFNELGEIMARMSTVHGRLDPANIANDLQPKGLGKIINWFNRTVVDIKTELAKRLKDADTVFDSIASDIQTHMTKHNIWIQDLENLYKENYENHLYIQSLIEKVKEWKQYQIDFIANIPPIDPADPQAMIKAQYLRDMEVRLNSIEIKLDNLERRKIVTENNAPLIRSKQQTSRATVSAMREVIAVIPDLKLQFVMYMHSLDSDESNMFNNSVKDIINQTIQTGATNAKNSALTAAASMNTSVISNDTLSHIRNAMLDTISGVQATEANAKLQREQDAIMMQSSQIEYLNQLQNKSNVTAVHSDAIGLTR